MTSLLKICPLFLAIAVASFVVSPTKSYFVYDSRYRQSEIEAAKDSIALTVMGQLQTSMFDLMWLKTMEYLHNGVIYRMPTSNEEEQGKHATDSMGTAAGLEHHEGVSMIPHKEEDWRGIIGDINRYTEPYKVVHSHSDPKELIPWYKFATKISPNQVRLYTMGAFFMADFAREPDEALELLEVGYESNPWSYEICASMGRLLFDYKQDYPKAAEYLSKAVTLGLKEKALYEKDDEKMDDYQQQLLRESYLFLAKSYTELGEYDKALATCDDGYNVTSHSHLRVQRRITERKQKGESNGNGNEEFVNTEGIISLIAAIREKRPVERLTNHIRANPDVVRALDPVAKNSAIHECARTGYDEFLSVLLDFGADVNMRDGNGDTPLKIAVGAGHQETAKLLEQRGGLLLSNNEVVGDDHNTKASAQSSSAPAPATPPTPTPTPTPEGTSTPLPSQVEPAPAPDGALIVFQEPTKLEIDEFLLLLRKGKSIRRLAQTIPRLGWTKIADADGRTALHYAAQVGYRRVLEMLMEDGANVNVKDNSGNTPLYYATKAGNKEIADLLRTNGAE